MPFLEDVLFYGYSLKWKRLLEKLIGFIMKQSENWNEKSGFNFWLEMREKTKKMDY